MIGLVDHVMDLDPVIEWVSSKLSMADRLVSLDESSLGLRQRPKCFAF